MATPRKRQGATPASASASTPAPAPTPAPAAAKPASAPAEPRREEPKRREEEREEPQRERKSSAPVKQAAPPALPGPTGDFTPPTSAQRAATAAAALGAQTAAKAAQVAATASSPPPTVATVAGGRETTAVYVPPEELEALKPYLTALGRVEELRRQGKIGYDPLILPEDRLNLRPVKITPKPRRKPLKRKPYANLIEMPTAEELDLPILAARKMPQVMRDRDLLKQQRAENQLEIARLEDQLSAARDPTTLDPTKSRAAQMEARAKEMEAISRQLKQMAAQQRGLQERILTKNATLREYGMIDEEIEPK